MKIRTDFVTNSSSSSFIIARKEKMTEAEKAKVFDKIIEMFLGECVLKPGCTDEEIRKYEEENYIEWDDEEEQDIKAMLEAGKSIYSGWVSFEEAEWELADMYKSIWKLMEESDIGFEVIDGDLSY